jgi:predicted nucleic acid-binding protein
VIVVDASALVDWLLNAPHVGRRVGMQIAEATSLHTVDLAQVEVVSALRRKVARGDLDPHRAAQALGDLSETRIHFHGAGPLLSRIWALRDSHSSYDAAYIALAEALSVPLLTTDGHLARSHGHRAEVVFLG